MHVKTIVAIFVGIGFSLLPGSVLGAPVDYLCDVDVPDGLSTKDRWDRFEFTQLDQTILDKDIDVKTYWNSWVTGSQASQSERVELVFVDHLPQPRCPECYEFIARTNPKLEAASYFIFFRFSLDKAKAKLKVETQQVSTYKKGYTQKEIDDGDMLEEKAWRSFGLKGNKASFCSRIKHSSIRGIPRP